MAVNRDIFSLENLLKVFLINIMEAETRWVRFPTPQLLKGQQSETECVGVGVSLKQLNCPKKHHVNSSVLSSTWYVQVFKETGWGKSTGTHMPCSGPTCAEEPVLQTTPYMGIWRAAGLRDLQAACHSLN